MTPRGNKRYGDLEFTDYSRVSAFYEITYLRPFGIRQFWHNSAWFQNNDSNQDELTTQKYLVWIWFYFLKIVFTINWILRYFMEFLEYHATSNEIF